MFEYVMLCADFKQVYLCVVLLKRKIEKSNC